MWERLEIKSNRGWMDMVGSLESGWSNSLRGK